MGPEIIFFLAPFVFPAWLDLGFHLRCREEKIGDHPFTERPAEHPWQEVFDFPDDESPVCLVSKFIIGTWGICDPDICIFLNNRRKIGIHHINKEILHDRKGSWTGEFFQPPLIFEFIVLWLCIRRVRPQKRQIKVLWKIYKANLGQKLVVIVNSGLLFIYVKNAVLLYISDMWYHCEL